MMETAAIYIHIPWCIRKCPYCDFNSHQIRGEDLPEFNYVDALLQDLDQDIARFSKRKISSIFIGGGTPSLFSAKAYERLFTGLADRLSLMPDLEITLEANPGSFEQQRFHDYRACGINRLSIGIQSFNPEKLAALGRIHDDKQARNAIPMARRAGFDNINLDIMHGLPNQSLEEGLADLQMALSFEVQHLSWYQLTIEANTVFYKKPPTLPAESICEALEQQGLYHLQNAGFKRYEISAFCRDDKKSQHNMNYWTFGDYFGIGAGAHGKLTDKHGIYRSRKQRQPHDYLNPDKSYTAAVHELKPQDILFEYMLNLSRLEAAIPVDLFQKRTGLDTHVLESHLNTAISQGLIECNGRQWRVTGLGRRFTNDLQAIFLSD